MSGAGRKEGWDWFLKQAEAVLAMPEFESERDAQLELAERLKHLLDAAQESGSLRPALDALLSVLSGRRPPRLAEWLQAWASSDEGSLRQAMLAYTDRDTDRGGRTPEDRFNRFVEVAKKAQGMEWRPATALLFGSMLNFATDPVSLPIVKAHDLVQLERSLGYDSQPAAEVGRQYAKHLAFARHLRTELSRASIPVRDMIDVEACASHSLRVGLTEKSQPRLPTADTIPMLRDSGWVMSLGERAAVEGLLSQTKPKLALEIGAGEGGSLRRLAAHSEEVHEIDLADPLPDLVELENVHWHAGDSHALLPSLLARFADEGRNVDFALVDGDHTSEGVRRDIDDLLGSPAVGRTVILVHDTMNGSTRRGLERVDYEGSGKVAYVELDFVPGYMFRDPVRRYQLWGGLGLIVVDASFSGATVRQDRYYEAHRLVREMQQVLIEREASAEIPGQQADTESA